MQSTPQLEATDLRPLLTQYVAGNKTAQQIADALNTLLRDKARDALAQEMAQTFTKGRAPNCF